MVLQKEDRMKGAQMYFKIQQLKGKSKRQIAKELGIHRNTVTKYLEMNSNEALQYFTKKVRRKSEFEQYRELILNAYQRYPGITQKRIYEMLTERYPEIKAGYRSLNHHINTHGLKEACKSTKQRHYEPVVDYKPGQLMQADLGEANVKCYDSDKSFKVYFVCFVLCHSRQMFVTFSTVPYNTESFIDAHNEVFEYLGAYPSAILYDQTKLVVIKEEYRELILNNEFGKYALQIGFNVRACEGYDPESKGMVEKAVSFVKSSFLNGRDFTGINDLRKQSFEWLHKANNRIHGTTKLVPAEQYKIEIKSMSLFAGAKGASDFRIADKTSLINYKGLKYSIPTKYQNMQVRIREKNRVLYVYEAEKDVLIAQWDLSAHQYVVNKNKNHYRDYHETLKAIKERMIKKLSTVYKSDIESFMKKLCMTCASPLRDQYRGLEKLIDRYPPDIWFEGSSIIASLPEISCTRVEKVLKGINHKRIIKQHNLTSDRSKPKVEVDNFRQINQYDKMFE